MKPVTMTFEELEAYLRDWASLAGPETYDFVGMVHLFRACLQNLMVNAVEDDWPEVAGVFTLEEREFLTRLLGHLRSADSGAARRG